MSFILSCNIQPEPNYRTIFKKMSPKLNIAFERWARYEVRRTKCLSRPQDVTNICDLGRERRGGLRRQSQGSARRTVAQNAEKTAKNRNVVFFDGNYVLQH